MAWIAFAAVVTLLLLLDLGVAHRNSQVLTMRQAFFWTCVWIFAALVFNLGILLFQGSDRALLFATGYLIEKALSVDNLFVFLMIFSFFKVPDELQHRVLFWGILGALILRGLLIAFGITMLDTFHWLIYPLGLFLIYTGWKTATSRHLEEDSEHPPGYSVMKFINRFVQVEEGYDGARFFTRRSGPLRPTTLFVVLMVVEFTDLLFALDSVPAILAITTDPFIVYTSNLFAILGLRALYFVVHGMMKLFRYLQHGVSVILVAIGVEMIAESVISVPDAVVLLLIVVIIATSIGLSIFIDRREARLGT